MRNIVARQIDDYCWNFKINDDEDTNYLARWVGDEVSIHLPNNNKLLAYASLKSVSAESDRLGLVMSLLYNWDKAKSNSRETLSESWTIFGI